MELVVHGHNVVVTEALESYARKKLAHLARFWGGVQAAQVLLEIERGQHICEATVPLRGAVLRGEARTKDMYGAIDEAVAKLERQIQRYRARFERQTATPARPEANALEGDEIVRQKRFSLKPMDPQEAVMQMNLLGHDFFAFMNSEVGYVNVVYRRHDGRYGLLGPEG
jgi:putative sigma-54 modulation protein